MLQYIVIALIFTPAALAIKCELQELLRAYQIKRIELKNAKEDERFVG